MLLNKVLKKMKDEEKAKNKNNKKNKPEEKNKKYPTSKLQTNSGFHAKANSLEGAARQRSMGNRMYKPSN
jgi:hypothetical protein